MFRLRQLFGLSTGASVALATAMAIVIVSCSTSPTNPVSPSATTPDAAGASSIRAATATNSTSPTPTPTTTPTTTPSPSPSPGEGRFTGGGFVLDIEDIGRVNYGLTIHCDLLLSNNLEINWGNGQNGQNFHLNIHETTVECSQGAPEEPPPAAPLDTLTGTGKGTFNGAEGFSITFTFVDGGEPGGLDQIALLITRDSDGAVILEVPHLTTVAGGNLQAHFDQPHK